MRHDKCGHNDNKKREREILRNTACKDMMILMVPTDPRTPS